MFVSILNVATLSGSGVNPASLGAIRSWVRGDSATMSGASAQTYSSLTESDNASLSDTWDGATDALPVRVAVGSNAGAITRGSRSFQHGGSASDWTICSDATSDFTLDRAQYFYQVTEGAVLFATKTTDASSRGLIVYVTGGVIRARWSDGTTNTDIDSVTALSAGTRHHIQVGKSGTAAWISVDGETVVTGTIDGSASAPAFAAYLGNNSAGTAAADGINLEQVLFDVELDSGGRSAMRTYAAAQWSTAPSWSMLKYSADVWMGWEADEETAHAGGTASGVADRYGYNNHGTAPTVSEEPDYVASWRNGKAALLGRPADTTSMDRSSYTGGSLTGAWTVIHVSESTDVGLRGFCASRTFTNLWQHSTVNANGYVRSYGPSQSYGYTLKQLTGVGVFAFEKNGSASMSLTAQDDEPYTGEHSQDIGSGTNSSFRALGLSNANSSPLPGHAARWYLLSGTLSKAEMVEAIAELGAVFDIDTPTATTSIVVDGDSNSSPTYFSPNWWTQSGAIWEAGGHPADALADNLAEGGSTWGTLAGREDRADRLAINQSNILVLWCGTNNLNSEEEDAPTALAAAQSYITDRVNSGLWDRIVLVQIPPVSDEPATDAQIDLYNAGLSGLTGVDQVIDWPATLNDSTDSTYYADHVHLNETGHGVIAQVIYDELKNHI